MSEDCKQKYSEKTNTESHINIFRSLEIENYIKQLFKKTNYELQNFKLNFSNSVLTLYLSKCSIYTRAQKKVKKKSLKFLDNPFWKNSIIKTLNQFTNNKSHVSLKVVRDPCFNNKISRSVQNMNFYRFRMPELQNLYTTLATHPNSPKLLSDFVVAQLRTTKRHNFFLNSLKESLTLLTKQRHSGIKGLKLIIKGRLNNAPRSQKRTIKVGKVPIMTQNIKITYSESTAYTSNGTIGVKLWISSKKQAKKRLFKQKKIPIKSLIL